MRSCLLAFVDDPGIQTRLESVAEEKQVECYLAKWGEQLSQLAKTLNPFLVVVDLSGQESEWLFKHINIIKHENPRLRIVAMTNAGQTDVKERADSYGCDLTLSKPDLFRRFPEIIESALGKTW